MFKKAVLFLLGFVMLLAACSPKITNEKIQKLEGREAVLAVTTEINKLNLEIEKELFKQSRLIEKVEEANEESSDSADEASKLADRLKRNPGDIKISDKANKAARRAARDAEKAREVNNELGEVVERIKDLRRDLERNEKALAELQATIEFVPNNQ